MVARRADIPEHAPVAEVAVGDVLAGKYRVDRILGEGGMGVVLSAMHLTLEERVAIKLMRQVALDHADGTARFLREARAAVRLKSDHVARVLDVGTLDTGAPYIVMEHLEGEDLAHVLARRGVLPVAEAIDLLLQACDAIAEAHVRGIIHRDLKPANLFVTQTREGAPLLKVLDFGISKVHALGDRPESMTSSAVLLGSPLYMSPEQMKSSRDVGPQTDIWSLGVILYEALGGRVPFDEQTMGALMAKVLTEPPPSLSTLQGTLPPPLVAAVERCLLKDPAQRYASVADFARDLAPFGGASAAVQLARITAMARGAETVRVGADARATVVTPPPHFDHPSILGVAATQAIGPPANSAVVRTGSKAGVISVAVGVALVAVAVGGYLVLGGIHRTGADSVATAAAAAPSASAAALASPPTVAPLASAPASPERSPTPEPSQSSASVSPSLTPLADAGTHATSPATASPSHAAHAPPPSHPQQPAGPKPKPASDPFGTSRQ